MNDEKNVVTKHKLVFNRRKMAVLFMAIAVFLSFLPHSQTIRNDFLFFHWKEKVAASIKPGLLSTLIAVVLYLSVVVRHRKKLFTDAYDTIITLLNILFCASFLTVFVNGKPWPIPFIKISSHSVLIVAIIMSWLGMSVFSGFIWIFLFLVAISRMATVDIAMGTAGVVYILSAFLSIGMQSDNIGDVFEEIKNGFFGTANRIKNDASSSISAAKSAISGYSANVRSVNQDTPDQEIRRIPAKDSGKFRTDDSD